MDIRPVSSPAMRRRRRGLGAWLALAFSSMTVVLTLLLVAVVERASTEQVKDSIGHGLAELALQTADKLDSGMAERYREVGLMAGRRDLRDPAVPKDERRRMLADMQRTYGYYDWIGLAGLDGRVIVEARGLLEGADVSARPWFSKALDNVHVGDVHEAVKLAKLLPGLNGEPRRFVDVAFPYTDLAGKRAGVLGAHLSWQWAQDVERSIIAPVESRGRVQALIVGRDGEVLLGPRALQGDTIAPDSLRLAQGKHTGYVVERWDDGATYLVGYAATAGRGAYPGLGWTVLVRQNIEDAYRPVRRLREQALWSGAALAVLFSVAGLVLARRITRPLGALAESAERMGRGETVALVPAARDYHEVQALSGSLNRLMTDLLAERAALRDLNASLERRVEERTRDLERALAAVQASEQRINAIVEAAQDAFVAVDRRGLVLDWNGAAERMLGWRRQDAVGWPLSELVLPERYRASFAQALHAFNHSGHLDLLGRRLERTVIDRQGREITVEMTATLAGAGDDAFFSVFMHDIAERKRREAGATAVVRTAQPLLPVLERALTAMEGKAREGDVILRRVWHPDARHIAAAIDPDRMEQVLCNLVSNAIKFTPRYRAVTVDLARAGGKVSLHVQDEGPGIAPDLQDRIFARSEETSSSGLGLALSKTIIEEHGGTISYTTAAGKGTRFLIELPAAALA
ncbi:ATP-binding protein [Massilia sp. G4R7]|uniref:histidine kinase n=1 Tax=Massilia phyllostachyos TaxID=2898585 RepID=A0ABS8QA99_9BURK|nr:ATP-binding protein [Massilia phyllostachyos]MCD2518683.1 ATP-binding protein [Massilia phyllostachyos]